MSWKDTKNIKRIFNTFKRLKNNIFNEDIEALKELNTSLLNSQKEYVNDNILFLKLLAIQIKLNLEYYGDIKIAIKKVDSDLKLSITDHIEMLRISLNNNDKMNYLESIGIDLESNDNQSEILKPNEKEFLEVLLKNWEFHNVEKSIYNTANDFLKDLNNY